MRTLLLVFLAGCSSGRQRQVAAAGGGGAPACAAEACAPGSYFQWNAEPPARAGTCCSSAGEQPVCVVDAGQLSHTCPGCPGFNGTDWPEPCAWASADGGVTCAVFGP